MTDPKIELFPTVRIVTPNSEITIPCELVTPDIAITPYMEVDSYQFGGGYRLTHVPTGLAFGAGQACLECAREAARQMAATTVDWESITTHDSEAFKASLGDQYEAVIAALRLFGKCGQQMCFHDEETCDACGMERQHAPYCIYIVGPMVAEHNARIQAKEGAN
jgi:hypothetical protein